MLKVKNILLYVTVFICLSYFTIYPHLSLIEFRSTEIIDNIGIEQSNQPLKHTLYPNDVMSDSIILYKELKQIVLKIESDSLENNIYIDIILKQNNNELTKHIIANNNAKDISIDLSNDNIQKGNLDVQIINKSNKNNLYLFTNYSDVSSGYLFINDKPVDALNLQLKLVYKYGDFFYISIILLIIIILIQFYLTYAVTIKHFNDNRVFYLTSVLFLLVFMLRMPLLSFAAEPFYETLTKYLAVYFNPDATMLDKLLLYDYGMTILPSIINITAYIMGLDKYLVIYLYCSGMVITSLWLALFTLNSLRQYLPDALRLIMITSFLNIFDAETFYISSMFAYNGIFFIIFLFIYDINKLPKGLFIASILLAASIICSKTAYVIIIPGILFITLVCYKLLSRRRIILNTSLILSAMINILYLSSAKTNEISQQNIKPTIPDNISILIEKILYYHSDIIVSAVAMYKIFTKYQNIICWVIILVIVLISLINIKKSHHKLFYTYIIAIFITIGSQISLLMITNAIKTPEILDWNKFIFITHYRHIFFSYVFTYVLLILLFSYSFTYYKNIKHKVYISICSCFIILSFIYSQIGNYSSYITRFDSYTKINYYKWTDVYDKFNTQYISIPGPAFIPAFAYLQNNTIPITVVTKDSYNDASIGFNNILPTKNILAINNLSSNELLKTKCYNTITIEKADIMHNYGPAVIFLYDNTKLIATKQQVNTSILNNPKAIFMFDNPICDIDSIKIFINKSQIPIKNKLEFSALKDY